MRNRLRLFLLHGLCGLGVKDMAVVYATLIIKGKKTLDQVPAMLRSEVEQIIKDLEIKL